MVDRDTELENELHVEAQFGNDANFNNCLEKNIGLSRWTIQKFKE